MMADLFAQDWAKAFGWTLLHSLWQSFIILLFLAIALRCIPLSLSRIRYGLSSMALLLFTLASGYTFFHLLNQAPAPLVEPVMINTAIETERSLPSGSSPFRDIISQVTASIESGIPVVVTAWIIGFFIYTIRLIRGVIYTRQLICAAAPLNNEWSEYASTISKRLGIRRLVTLAESGSIVTPMVVGYFKPVILIPIGMLTGLTTEQLETVFLHELAHIRRQDYLVNLIQSAIETLFFFNPFTWGLSNLIRREREFCCDDLVLQQHGGAGAYAYALLQLAEVRLSKQNFAMRLAANNNQLLNRIRRIMEKSVRSRSEKGRMIIPALLLAAGLLCVSWLGIEEEKNYQGNNTVVKQDRLIKKKEKNDEHTRYSRKPIIRKDKNGKPHEEVTEEFEGDERLRPLVERDIPDVPDAQLPPPLPPAGPNAPHLELPSVPDSIPGLGFHFRHQDQWEAFSKNFEDNFRKRFDHLYSGEEIDASEFLKEFEEKFESEHWSAPWRNFSLPGDAFRYFNFDDNEAFEDLKDRLQHLEELEIFAHPFFHEEYNKEFTEYERLLQDELIKDGYLSQGEAIQSMEWSDEVFKVNGRTIKEGDRKKYQELRSRFSTKPPLGGKLE
jgi:bla regulator protein BlaR1